MQRPKDPGTREEWLTDPQLLRRAATPESRAARESCFRSVHDAGRGAHARLCARKIVRRIVNFT
jgi:hypothetical protein